MSTEIDQRIVEMKFDREGFSESVDKTIKDLDKLESSMEFKNASDGFKHLQSSVDGVKFDHMLEGIESISNSLDRMQSFGYQVFENLSNKAVDWLVNTTKSLSIDQISGGFKEYELKMDSVKTIMASTHRPIEEVQEYLEELNKYADKTIYSFSDMTASIGKFTNAGVELEDAVLAIQGISNEAALSGANAQEASRAMYNFAQALSSGSVKLIDWKSIENANMATKEFKQALIDTAVSLGTVVEEEGRYVSTTTNAQGKTSDLFDAVGNFNDSLSAQWLTTDVLISTLSRYADEEDELGRAAFAAAQEVTTYSKMMDALKESVGSGWAQTFEILFGNLEEAKVLWTGINNVMSGIIQRISDTRNGILQLWKASGGHTALFDAFKNLWTVISNVSEYIGLALETITGHRFLQNFDDIREFFGEGFQGNIVVIKKITKLLVGFSYKFKEVTATLKSFFDKDVDKSRRFLEEIYQTTQAILIPARFIGRIITGIVSKTLPVAVKLIGGIGRTVIFLLSRIGYALTEGGLQMKLYAIADGLVGAFGKAVDFIETIFGGIVTFITGLLTSGKLPNGIGSISELIQNTLGTVMDWANMAISFITTKAQNIKTIITPFMTTVSNKIKKFTSDLTEFWNKTLGPAVSNFIKIVPSAATSVYNTVVDIVNTIWPVIKSFGSGTWGFISGIIDKIQGFATSKLGNMGFGSISEFIQYLGQNALPIIQTGLGKISGAVEFIVKKILPKASTGLKNVLKIFKKIFNFLKQIKKALNPTFTKISDFGKDIKEIFDKFDLDTGFVNSVKTKFDTVTNSIKGFFTEVKDSPKRSIEDTTKAINDFVSEGMTVEEATKKVKNLNGEFEDLGGLFDWGKDKFSKFADSIMNSKLVKTISSFLDKIVNKLKNNEFIKGLLNSDLVKNVKSIVSSIIEGIGKVDIAGALKEIGGYIKTLIDDLKQVDFSTIDSAFSGIAEAFGKFTESVANFSTSKLDDITAKIQSFWNSLKPSADPKEDSEIQQNIFQRFTQIVWSAVGGLINGVAKLNWENIFKIIKGILGIMALKSLVGIFSKGEKAAKGLDKLTQILANTLDKITAVFTTSKWMILAQSFQIFAKSMVYLTGAIVVLALIPPDALDRALDAFTHIVFMSVIFYAVKGIIDKFISNSKIAAASAITAADSVIATKNTISKFIDSVDKFAEMIAKNVGIVLKKIGNAFIIVALGAAVAVIAFALIQISKNVDSGKLWDSMYVIAAIFGAIVTSIGILQTIDHLTDTNIGDYIGLALMMFSLTKVLKEFMKFHEWSKDIPFMDILATFGKYALIVGGTEALIGALLFVVNKFGIQIASASKSIGSLGLALLAFVAPLLIISSLGIEKVLGGLAGMLGIVVVITTMSMAVDKLNNLGGSGSAVKTLNGLALGMLEIAAAILVFSNAIGNLVTAAERMTTLGDAANHVYYFLGAFAGLVTVVIVGVVALSTVTAPVVPIFLALGGALALAGLAFFLVGAGIDAAAKGIVRLAENMDTIVDSVKGREKDVLSAVYTIASGVVKAVAEGIAYVLKLIAQGLWDAIMLFRDNAYTLGSSIGLGITDLIMGLLTGAVTGLIKGIGHLGEVCVNLVGFVKDKLTGKTQEISDEMLVQAEEAIQNNDTAWMMANTAAVEEYYARQKTAVQTGGDETAALMGEAGDKAATSYKENLQNGGNSPADSTAEAMNQQTQVINEKTPEVVEAAAQSAQQVTEAANPTSGFGFNAQTAASLMGEVLSDALPEQISQGVSNGVNGANVGTLVSNLLVPGSEEAGVDGANALTDSYTQMIGDNADGVGMDADQYIAQSLGEYSDILDEAGVDLGDGTVESYMDADWSAGGEAADNGIAESINDNSKIVVEATENTIDDATTAGYATAVVDASKVGDAMVDGVKIPILRRADEIINEYAGVVRDSITAMENEANVNSPSKETMWISNMLFDGLLKPIPNRGEEVIGSFGTVAKNVVSAMAKCISGAKSVFNDELSYSPVITPVLDSSGVRYGMANLNGTLNSQQYATIGARLNVDRVDVGSAVGDLGKMTSKGNGDILQALREQSARINKLIDVIETQNIYLDGDILVGATASKMDRALGRRSVMGGRRG